MSKSIKKILDGQDFKMFLKEHRAKTNHDDNKLKNLLNDKFDKQTIESLNFESTDEKEVISESARIKPFLKKYKPMILMYLKYKLDKSSSEELLEMMEDYDTSPDDALYSLLLLAHKYKIPLK